MGDILRVSVPSAVATVAVMSAVDVNVDGIGVGHRPIVDHHGARCVASGSRRDDTSARGSAVRWPSGRLFATTIVSSAIRLVGLT